MVMSLAALIVVRQHVVCQLNVNMGLMYVPIVIHVLAIDMMKTPEIKRIEKIGSRLLIVTHADQSILISQEELACLGYFFGRTVEHVIKHHEDLFDHYRDNLKPTFVKRQHLRVIK